MGRGVASELHVNGGHMLAPASMEPSIDLHSSSMFSNAPTTLSQIYANSPSTSSKWSKNPLNNLTPNPGSKLPVVARILCILNCGSPASIALIPVAADNIGPTVPPLRLSFRI